MSAIHTIIFWDITSGKIGANNQIYAFFSDNSKKNKFQGPCPNFSKFIQLFST
jgi:hypothetical protein